MWFSNKFNPTTDLSDMTGKVVLVTGANTGIGYTTVKHLARKGAKVYLGSRSEEKGNKAVEDLKKEDSGVIGNLQSAKESAEEFLKLEDRLDVLINNGASAGKVYGDTETPSQDGITEPSRINHFGTVLFTKALLPLLRKTAEGPDSDVRIITFACARLGRNPFVNFKTLAEFKRTHDDTKLPWMVRYSTSKLANVVYTRALQRRLSSTKIICMTVHPGLDEGSYTSCIAAASPKVREFEELYKGAYLTPIGKISKPAPAVFNENIQDDLWQTTEKYFEEHGLLRSSNLM